MTFKNLKQYFDPQYLLTHNSPKHVNCQLSTINCQLLPSYAHSPHGYATPIVSIEPAAINPPRF
ncbi:MAG: hypothetical protein HC894_27785 [Microcoleus sp. SM1_3_4]|nr:hypothetical protein [Microcoleus sp. SM1_3_4]